MCSSVQLSSGEQGLRTLKMGVVGGWHPGGGWIWVDLGSHGVGGDVRKWAWRVYLV